jgi:hypothetical protein
MLAAGDFDEQRVVLAYYENLARLLGPRTLAWFNHSGLWTTETHTLFGAYTGPDYGGAGCALARPSGYPPSLGASRFIHLDAGGDSGTAEWALMALDRLAHTGDASFLPLAFGAADFFMYHWPRLNATTGRAVLWPVQVLEGWQCDFNASAGAFQDCCSDDAPTISGMLALFEKLLQLPPALATAEQRARWREFSELRMPALPLAPDGSGGVAAARVLNRGGSGSGEAPTLYPIHPHRWFTKGREVATGRSLDVALASLRAADAFVQANVGWHYGLLAAALVGAADVAAPLLLARAASGSAPGYRWPGFAPKYQDSAPSFDHFSNMNRCLLDMLLQGGEDGFENATIVLFPAWPCTWDVDLRLHATQNTTVELSYAGGALRGLVVTPASRAGAVRFANCVA